MAREVRFSTSRLPVPIEMEMAQVCTIEDGKVRRIEEYVDRTDGLEAAGLGE
jgi:ketosteroid isomerase-like protein